MPRDTAKRLIDAALLSVREHGYAGTSMQELLRSTKVSSSSMYHHFPGGKEELVASAVRRSGLEAAEQIAAVFRGHDFAGGIALIFEASAAEMASHDFRLGCPIGVPATEASADSERIQAATAEVFDAWAAAYAGALREAGVAEGELESLSRFVVATYEGTVTLARALRSTAPYGDAAAVLRGLVAN